jgi:histidinol-phosphate aminotransferase
MESVTTGAGSDDVLDSTFRAAWTPNGHISYAAPTFSMVEPFARMNGLEARAVSWPEADDDPSVLLEGDPVLVYVCRPNNPTGHLAPQTWIERLLEARGVGGPLVIIDEAYADFAGETMLPEAPSRPNLLVARTTSKAFGLAGMRCGFAVGAPDVVLAIEKSRGPYKVSGLAAAAAAAALRDVEEWLPSVIEPCLENRARLTQELEQRGLRPLPSAANFILCAAPTGAARPDALALREAGIGVRPFTGIPELGEGIRVTVGPWPLMEEFLEVLDRTFSLVTAS